MDRIFLLPVFETIRLSWQKVKGCKKTIWGAYSWIGLVALVFSLSAYALTLLNHSLATDFSLAIKALNFFLSIALSFGALRLGILRAFDHPITAAMVFYPLRSRFLILKLLGFWALYSLIIFPVVVVGAGCFGYLFAHGIGSFSWHSWALLSIGVCACLAYLFIIVRLRFGWACILDKEVGPWRAIQLSFKLTHRNFWRLVGLVILNSGIVFLSVLPLGLGLIWTLPYLLLNYGMTYRILREGQA